MTALAARAPLASAAPPGHRPPPRFRTSTRYDDSDVLRVREIIGLSRLVPFFETRLARATGRRMEGLTVEAMLVAMLCAACDRRAMHLAEREQNSAVKQVERLFHRMLAPIDPSPYPKNRVLDPTAFAKKIKPMPQHEQDRRFDLLNWVANRLLEATLLALPDKVRKAWNGSLVQDATYLKVWAQFNKKNPDGTLRWMSSDPDAGWYIRHGDHYSNGTQGRDKIKLGMEAELAVMGPDDPARRQAFPNLVVAMALKAPGLDPAGMSVRILTELSRRHLLADPETGEAFPPGAHPDGPAPAPHPTGWLAVDRAYSNADAAKWALPVRALGYRPVIDYRDDHLGLQGSDQGMILVEGRWYSPAMPKALVDATKHCKVDHTIDETLYRLRINERQQYEIRLGKPNADGDRRAACPAASTPSNKLRAVARCNEKADSLPNQHAFDARPVLTLPLTVAGAVPKICRATTVTLRAATHAKHQQDLAYESPEWSRVYHLLRNTVEGENAHAKDTATHGIEEAKRRVRGIAANTLLVAFMIASTRPTGTPTAA